MTALVQYWPPFGLILTTPRLELRPIRDEEIPAAAEAALSGIHEPGRSPFSRLWAEAAPEELGHNMAQWYWRCRGTTSPQDWTLLLGIWHDGAFIGCQDIAAKDFTTLKTVSTGSWLRQSVHGRGFGKEMRAAVALYAFDWLGAEVAESEAAVWNQQSLGVSRSLGYELNITRAEVSHLPLDKEALFLEVIVDDSSDFETELEVRGVTRHGYQILRSTGPWSRTPSPRCSCTSGT